MIQSEKVLNCPKVIMGSVASGKSTALIQQAIEIANSQGTAILFMNTEYLVEEVKMKENCNLEVWDFSEREVIEKFALSLNPNRQFDETISAIDLASKIDYLYQTYLLILENIGRYSLDDESKSILLAACKIIFSKPNQTFYDLYRFFISYNFRKKYFDKSYLNTNPLISEHELILLEKINEKETVRNRVGNQYESYEVETGETNLRHIKSLLERFELILSDFRIKKLLSNPLSDEYNLSQIFKPGKSIIFYFPRLEYSPSIRDSLITLLTLNIQMLQESQEKSSKSIHLMYDETAQTPNTLKLLTHSFDYFFKSNLCITLSTFSYEHVGKSLNQLTPYDPEYLLLSKPTSETLSCLDLSHLKELIYNLKWERNQALSLTRQIEPSQVILKQMPSFKTILS